MTQTDISPEKTHGRPTHTWKGAHCHESLEKWKSKPQWGAASDWSERPSSKSLPTTNVGEGGKKREFYTVGRNANWYSHYGEQFGGSSKTNRTTIWSSSPIPGHVTRENHNSKWYMYPNFTAARFTTARTREQPKCPSTDKEEVDTYIQWDITQS